MNGTTPGPEKATQRLALEIFLVSFAALLLEISYTRVFSFKISSYYTYLILGLALLGTGAGSVFVALLPALRRPRAVVLLPWIGLFGAVAVGLGYAVNADGRRRTCLIRAATTVSVSLPSSFTSIVNRDWRSTSVAM